MFLRIPATKISVFFSATELIDFTRATLSDEIEDEPGNPWDESTTPVGSHFGESGDRIRSGEDPIDFAFLRP